MKKILRTISTFAVASLPSIPLFFVHEKVGAVALFVMWCFALMAILPTAQQSVQTQESGGNSIQVQIRNGQKQKKKRKN